MSCAASISVMEEFDVCDNYEPKDDIDGRINKCIEMLHNEMHPDLNEDDTEYKLLCTPSKGKNKSFIECY
jgi:hypothetical protein